MEEEKNKELNKEFLENQWKEGESGNPNGRPKGQKNYATLYREALIKLAKLNNKSPDELELDILSKGILNARAGDYRFYKDLLDRLHGTAISRAELTGKDGNPIQTSYEVKLNEIRNEYGNKGGKCSKGTRKDI